MSKIQDALRRLQTSGDRTAGQQAATRDVRTGVATLSAEGVVGDDDNSEATHGIVVKVSHEALRDAGLIAPDYHEKMLADQYRDIKRPLIANMLGKRVAKVEDGNLIMVTSALPGEGKTFTSVNLAISIAQEQDLSVLLVDADVAKPHVSDVFGLSEMPGLLDLLDGDRKGPETLVVPTDLEGLSILPAGAPRLNATELLSGSRMENVVRQVATRIPERVVVFDTPPLLQTTESKVLTNMAGQVVLVVKAESTNQGAVAEAVRILGDERAVNLVLNQSRTAGQKIQYEYGYGFDKAN